MPEEIKDGDTVYHKSGSEDMRIFAITPDGGALCYAFTGLGGLWVIYPVSDLLHSEENGTHDIAPLPRPLCAFTGGHKSRKLTDEELSCIEKYREQFDQTMRRHVDRIEGLYALVCGEGRGI